MKYKIKNAYISKLSLSETLLAKEELRTNFKTRLKEKLNLIEVEPAIVTDNNMWLNDDFNNSERPIDFDTNIDVFGQVIQSNSKWRRKILTDLEEEKPNTGVLTDGLYLRRDRVVSNVSAIAFNEIGFDIPKSNYDVGEVKDILVSGYAELIESDRVLVANYKEINRDHFDSEITFVTSIQLKVMFPLFSFGERLNAFAKTSGSFILHDFVGSTLDSKQESVYSQDVYDFKSYCELYVYNKTIQQAICVGWGAYQVNRDQLKFQTELLHEDWKGKTEYENEIKSSDLVQSISISFDFPKIVMTVLEKQHIGEVVSSVWEPDFLEYAKINNIKII